MTAATVEHVERGEPTAPPIIDRMFVYDRPVPDEWTRRLREVSPQSDEMGFLDLLWESGDPWMPAQRYLLYEVFHPKLVHPGLLEQYRGPHPRQHGHICTSVPICDWAIRPPANYQPCLCRNKLEAWKGSMSAVGLTEWKYFQRTGYVPSRVFWAIQGNNGGHRLSFSDDEIQMLASEGYPTDVPAIGVLPYADFDERVVRAITRFNRLWQFKNDIDAFKKAMGPGYEAYQAEHARALRQQLVAEVTSEMESLREFVDREHFDDTPETDIDFERLDELSDREFIERGSALSASMVWTTRD